MMQFALCGALVATTGLAWWVGRTHARSLAVTLSTPVRFSNPIANLDLRLPVDWKIEIETTVAGEATLQMAEQNARYGSARDIVVHIVAIDPGAAMPAVEDVAKSELPDRPAEPATRLDFLGVHGSFIEYPRAQGVNDDGQPIFWKPALFGCAILNHPKVVVTLRLLGQRSMTPTSIDIDLFRQIARSMMLSDPSQKVTTLVTPADSDWRQTPADADADDSSAKPRKKKRLQKNDKDDGD